MQRRGPVLRSGPNTYLEDINPHHLPTVKKQSQEPVLVPVVFVYADPLASTVFVAGSFNEWSPDSTALRQAAPRIGRFRFRAPTDNDVQRMVELASRPLPDAATGQIRAAQWQIRCIDSARYDSFVQLLNYFSRQLSDWYVLKAPTKRPTELDAILRAREWIEAHYHEPLTLAKAAKVAQMSPTHFCRKFHGTTGVRFREFLTRMRIARVRQLLADPHNAIAESALAAGFQSVSQFNRIFHKLVGQSPSEYRAAFLARRPAAGSATIESQGLASPLSQSDAA